MSLKEAKNRVCVAMSGGVDSTAAAILLKNQGYDVFGLTMNLTGIELTDAKLAAEKIGIEHHFIDFQKEFREYVIDYFKNSYLNGLTPSPCIMCNKYIKLGLLIDKAKELGATKVVTGHYAKIKDGHLFCADDKSRDQSYFLCLVKKESLRLLDFPLENFTKAQTRELVKQAGIEIFNKPDSQDICFVPNGNYASLFDNLVCGNIVDLKGKVIGQHQGIVNHTIGQRKGLGVGGFVEPQYVVSINACNHEVIIGPQEALKTIEVFIKDVNLLEDVALVFDCQVKLRSKQDKVEGRVELLENNCAKIILKNPAYGIAKGQGCCFYDAELVLGGGIIC